jgi:hypothetical protein
MCDLIFYRETCCKAQLAGRRALDLHAPLHLLNRLSVCERGVICQFFNSVPTPAPGGAPCARSQLGLASSPRIRCDWQRPGSLSDTKFDLIRVTTN